MKGSADPNGKGRESLSGRRPGPVFLERRGYRQRRMIDALRLLPLLGGALFLLPVLWPEGEGGVRTSDALKYIFGSWIVLTVLARVALFFLSEEAVDRLDAGERPEPVERRSGHAVTGDGQPERRKSP